MIALLQQADSQGSAGTCAGSQAKVREAEGVLATLPKSVDSKLRSELANGMERLRTLIADQCQRRQRRVVGRSNDACRNGRDQVRQARVPCEQLTQAGWRQWAWRQQADCWSPWPQPCWRN